MWDFLYSEIWLSLIYTNFDGSHGPVHHSPTHGERDELIKRRSTHSKLSVEMPRETPEANLVKKT